PGDRPGEGRDEGGAVEGRPGRRHARRRRRGRAADAALPLAGADVRAGERDGRGLGRPDRRGAVGGGRRRARRRRPFPAAPGHSPAPADRRDVEGGRPMGEETDQLRREIETTREDLSRNVDALTYKASPSRIVGDRVEGAKSRVSRAKDRVFGTASGAGSAVQDRAAPGGARD